MAGRPQESSRTGKTYQLAEFMNRNWDDRVGRTNDDVAQELGYRSSNLISMWRTGRTRIPLNRLPDIARLMKVDLAELLPLWFEQQFGGDSGEVAIKNKLAGHLASEGEAELLGALRDARPTPGLKFSDKQIAAIIAVATDDVIRDRVLAQIEVS